MTSRDKIPFVISFAYTNLTYKASEKWGLVHDATPSSLSRYSTLCDLMYLDRVTSVTILSRLVTFRLRVHEITSLSSDVSRE